MLKKVNENDLAIKGDYILTYSSYLLPEMFAWVLDNLKGLLNTLIEYTQDKHLTITKVETKEIEGETKILLYVTIIDNAVQWGVVLAGLILAVGIIGFLSLDKIEAILDEPAGAIVSIGGIIIILVLLFLGIKIFNKGK